MPDKTAIGTRMKGYEDSTRFLPTLPIVIRIDGKKFSRWTRGLPKPYSSEFIELMIRTTGELVKQTNARIGYTQSDEITLVLQAAGKHNSEVFFDGRIQKIISVTASIATAVFNDLRPQILPNYVGYGPAFFDARAFVVPSRHEAANAVLWRELDATKNAISMMAQSKYSHAQLKYVNTSQMQEMLWKDHNINFNDLSRRFRRGTYMQSRQFEVTPTVEELSAIPEDKRREGPYIRSHVVELDMPIFTKVLNRVEVIFDKEDPRVDGEKDADLL